MRIEHVSCEPIELKLLRELSARLGSNPLLVQASTGNTSVKLDDVLWIKASGKWLIDADSEDFLIPIKLQTVRTCLQTNTDLNAAVNHRACGSHRSASIETAMHAVLPHTVVVHVHSVNTIAWAVRKDAEKQLAARLEGLHWQWIPYRPSGVALARKIEEIISHSPQTNVWVLGNHGLVVCGSTCDATEALLVEVEDRLKLQPRPAPPGTEHFPFTQCSVESGWRWPAPSRVHALATDPYTKQILARGVLYPCQAIFLPESTPVCASSSHGPEQSGSASGNYAKRQPFLIVEDRGVAISDTITRAELAMLNALAEVAQRIEPSAVLRYLSDPELSSVLNEGADSYRQIADPDGCSSRTGSSSFQPSGS